MWMRYVWQREGGPGQTTGAAARAHLQGSRSWQRRGSDPTVPAPHLPTSRRYVCSYCAVNAMDDGGCLQLQRIKENRRVAPRRALQKITDPRPPLHSSPAIDSERMGAAMEGSPGVWAPPVSTEQSSGSTALSAGLLVVAGERCMCMHLKI